MHEGISDRNWYPGTTNNGYGTFLCLDRADELERHTDGMGKRPDELSLAG